MTIKAKDNTDLVNQLKNLKLDGYDDSIELDFDFDIGKTAIKYFEKEYPELLNSTEPISEPKPDTEVNNDPNAWYITKKGKYWYGNKIMGATFIKKFGFKEIPISEVPEKHINNE
jgi:hypothetical protein